MNRLVAPLAGHQGLPPTRGHASDPEGLLPPSWFAQVGEFADVVHFAVLRGSTQFACLSEKALDHLAAMAYTCFGSSSRMACFCHRSSMPPNRATNGAFPSPRACRASSTWRVP
jgi:hypothetical protein